MIVPHIAKLRRTNVQPFAKRLWKGVDRRARDGKPLQPRAGEAERAMEAVRRDARVILEAERTIGQQPPDKGGAARRVADRQQQQRDRKSTRLNSSHSCASRMPSSA